MAYVHHFVNATMSLPLEMEEWILFSSTSCSYTSYLHASNSNIKCHLDCKSQSSLSSNSKSPLESLVNTVWNALQKPAAAAILIGFLLMYVPNNGLAASGGAMGGSSFSSSSDSSSYSSSSSSSSFDNLTPYESLCVLLVLSVGYLAVYFYTYLCNEITTVLKYQVGLKGMDPSLQRDLNRIAEVADTSTRKGWSFSSIAETTLALLRHPDYCISGYSSVDIKLGIENVKKLFKKLSTEERGKFDEETLVNVNNVKRQSTISPRFNEFSNEYLVITILVAAEGVLKIPRIKGSGNLKEALQKLGSIPSSKLLAVEVSSIF